MGAVDETNPSDLGRESGTTSPDVVVVGAGIGGLYAIRKFREIGLSVIGLEAAADVGGVWFHNRYPGARVDLESHDYCYFFSSELFNEWKWTERYAAQPEILSYLNHVADRFDIRKQIAFNTRLEAAHWRSGYWHLRTSRGEALRCRYLVMATGNLSASRPPDFPGLDTFRGEWVETSHWPNGRVDIKNRRVGVIGTGSSGTQCIPIIAEQARHLHVFQRTPNYSIPAHNTGADQTIIDEIGSSLTDARKAMLGTTIGKYGRTGLEATDPASARALTKEACVVELERAWDAGGHAMASVFSDQGTDKTANDIVAGFVHDKIRKMVPGPLAEALLPSYPIGTRRLCVDTGYYATFNRDNVTLVDLRKETIQCVSEKGISTSAQDYELDVIVFALGFEAFDGQLNRIDIRNEKGVHVTADWNRGPGAYLGLQVADFPNLFLLTGPGSPSVLSNLFALNEYHVNWVADLFTYMNRRGYTSVAASAEAQKAWTQHVQDVARPLLRFGVKNYMVHANLDDESRVFIPYAGGLNRYVRHCDQVAKRDYDGLRFSRQSHLTNANGS